MKHRSFQDSDVSRFANDEDGRFEHPAGPVFCWDPVRTSKFSHAPEFFHNLLVSSFKFFVAKTDTDSELRLHVDTTIGSDSLARMIHEGLSRKRADASETSSKSAFMAESFMDNAG